MKNKNSHRLVFKLLVLNGNKKTTKSKGPKTKMLLVYVGAGDSSNQPNIKIQKQGQQGLHYVEIKKNVFLRSVSLAVLVFVEKKIRYL